MQAGTHKFRRRVKGCDGTTWETSASSASEYVFTPVFMSFFVLCVVLYAMLVQPSAEMDLPRVAEFLVWSALLMSSLLWLVIGVSLNVALVDKGYMKTIFTPFILVPLILINSFMSNFILEQFSTQFESVYGSRIESLVRDAIVFICFDIFHSRFVAPQHPTFIHTDRRRAPSYEAPLNDGDANRPVAPALSKTEPLASTDSAANAPPSPQNPGIARPAKADARSGTTVEIGNVKLDPEKILWIKSEDHYLSVQLAHKSVMVRGKLGAAVTTLDDDLGLQINRSVWIAFSAIQTIEESSKGAITVRLTDDTTYRVASTRSIMLKHAYERYQSSKSDT